MTGHAAAPPAARLRDGRLPARDVLVLLLLCATWGFGQVAMKVGGEGISPLMQAGLRSILAIPVLLVWCRWRGVTVWRRDGSLWPGLLTGVLFALEFWAIFAALERTTAARTVVLLYSGPFFGALGAHLLLRDGGLTRRKLAGLLLAFGGLPVAFADRLGATADAALLGDLLALLAGLAWGSIIATMKASRLDRVAPERTLLYQLGVSALLVPLSLLVGERGVFAPTALVGLALLYQVLGVAVASYVVWFGLVMRHQASRLAPFLVLTPVFGVGFAALLLGEAVTPALLLALAMIAAGIVVVNRA